MHEPQGGRKVNGLSIEEVATALKPALVSTQTSITNMQSLLQVSGATQTESCVKALILHAFIREGPNRELYSLPNLSPVKIIRMSTHT